MYQFSEDTKFQLFVIGAGGTGGWLIPYLDKLGNNVIDIVILDGDKVEDKNILRQNFRQSEVGENKADALIVSMNASERVQSINEYVSSEELFYEELQEGAVPIIIGAVDNNSSRLIINEFMRGYNSNAVWIDAGNAERHGQVVVNILDESGDVVDGFESPLTKHPDLADVSTPDQLHPNIASCAEHSESSPQNIAANIMSATAIFILLNQLVNNELLLSSELKFDSQALLIQ